MGISTAISHVSRVSAIRHRFVTQQVAQTEAVIPSPVNI